MMIRAYRWYGGKLRVVHELNSCIPKHQEYYEPFMGSAALLLNHPRSLVEVLNDKDEDLVCLMKTLADRKKGKKLIKRFCHLCYGKEVYQEAERHRKNGYKGLSEVERAEKVYILITQSFNATRKGFGRSTYPDTYSYQKDILFHLPHVYERMKGVKVLHGDGIDLIAKIAENPNAFVMADPPYRASLRGKGADKVYACELPDNEQRRLLETIRSCQCKVLLCGYKEQGKGDLYDRSLLPYGWKCYKLKDLVKTCQVKKQKDVGQEYIWVNYNLPDLARYTISMKEESS